jgi:hypothetical protein
MLRVLKRFAYGKLLGKLLVIIKKVLYNILGDILPDKELQNLLHQWRMIYSYYIKNLETTAKGDLDETPEEAMINHELVVRSI